MCALDISPAIGTDRLVLRKPQRDDAPRMARLANDQGVAAMTSNMPFPYGLADAEAFLDRPAGTDGGRAFAIEHRDEGFIGMLAFMKKDSPGLELGYWLGRPYWGQGLATEAVNGALSWARDGWRRRLVVAGHFADNPASGQVLIKAGFLYTGDVQPRPSLARGDIAPTRMMVWLA